MGSGRGAHAAYWTLSYYAALDVELPGNRPSPYLTGQNQQAARNGYYKTQLLTGNSFRTRR